MLVLEVSSDSRIMVTVLNFEFKLNPWAIIFKIYYCPTTQAPTLCQTGNHQYSVAMFVIWPLPHHGFQPQSISLSAVFEH